MWAMNMTAKVTAIFVPIAIASVCKECLSLNFKDFSLRINLIRSPKNVVGIGGIFKNGSDH